MHPTIKSRREGLGLSIAKLAHDIDVSLNTVKNWENGVVDPSKMSFENAWKLAECLDVSVQGLWKMIH